ncbi:MAG: hypothetical protein QNJ38_24325 [Prochloraceae cyanobacterium]|nr:hypothetical protein [Prochloraceae cyanobacterium]
MTEIPQDNSARLSDDEALELFDSLLKKEGNWVDWGKTCDRLQKAGHNSQVIFEKTGFQASQQNLIIVAAKVYESLETSGADDNLLKYFLGPKSDVLYEFRTLAKQQRLAAANLAKDKQLEAIEAREVARAIVEFDRLSQPPIGFANPPGDAVAYQYWLKAKQKKQLADRARLIAKGLRFASSTSAREKIEQLLGEFTVTPSQAAPLMPIYRLEQEEELARIIPALADWPQTVSEIEQLDRISPSKPFGLVSSSRGNSMVAVPGWQAILSARDPVAIVANSDRLPKKIPGSSESVLVVIDRAALDWNVNSYFLVAIEGELKIAWFDLEPDLKIIVGQIILIMRAKKILDEDNITQPWQMDD